MLNKEEELRLASILGVIENDTAEGIMYVCNEQTMKWLAQKCKELNEEATGYLVSYTEANRELIALQEHYEGT